MHRHARQAVDALAYALVLTSVAFVAAAVVSYPLGVGLLGVKWILFVVGFVLFGYATFHLRPTPPWKRDSTSQDGGEPRGFQKWVAEALPAGVRLAPDDRLPAGVKLFLAAVSILLTSFLLEAVLRVGY